jgi:hypothetical protein
MVEADKLAGAEFAEFILQAAFNGKSSTVQAYVHLSAESGGEAIKKEIGSDLDYFSVNVQLGVSCLSSFYGNELISRNPVLRRSCPLVRSMMPRRSCSLLPSRSLDLALRRYVNL